MNFDDVEVQCTFSDKQVLTIHINGNKNFSGLRASIQESDKKSVYKKATILLNVLGSEFTSS